MSRFTGKAFEATSYGLYFLFAACMVLFPCVIYMLYPETKEVPLEAIDYLFEVPAWRARDYAMSKFEIEYEGQYTADPSSSEQSFHEAHFPDKGNS